MEPMEIEEQGFWKDKSFKKYDIRSWLQKGVNEVILELISDSLRRYTMFVWRGCS